MGNRSAAPRGIALALLLLASSGLAEPAPEADASAHFNRGVELTRNGDLAAAAQEFEQAYALSPHYAVLYNLGLAQAALGQPVEAIRTLRRYLVEGGDAIAPERRQQVEATIALNEKQIGKLIVDVTPRAAQLEVDGRRIDRRDEEQSLKAGRHVVLATLPGYEPKSSVVDIPSMASVTVHLELRLLATGWLGVRCVVPDMEVAVDGVPVAKTPAASPLRVPVGQHAVRFSRPGYAVTEANVSIPAALVVFADCRAAPSPNLSPGLSGELRAKVSEPEAVIQVDGSRFTGQRLPVGVHRVDVQRYGFEPWSAPVRIAAQQPALIVASLVPTQEFRVTYERRAKRERVLAYVAAGAGVALEAAAAGLYAASNNRYHRWRAHRDQLLGDMTAPDAAEESGRVQAEAVSIQRMDDGALAMAILGGALLATSAGLWIWGADPHRYEERPAASVSIGRLLSGRWSW